MLVPPTPAHPVCRRWIVLLLGGSEDVVTGFELGLQVVPACRLSLVAEALRSLPSPPSAPALLYIPCSRTPSRYALKFNECEEIPVSRLARGINVSDAEIVRHLFPLVRGVILSVRLPLWAVEFCELSRIPSDKQRPGRFSWSFPLAAA